MPITFRAATIKASILDAVAEEAEASILAKADEYIPKDTETAESSGRVVKDGERVVVTFGRDDDRNPRTGQSSNTYIVPLHEDMEAHHPNGRAKFLQIAGDEASAGFAERVGRRVKL